MIVSKAVVFMMLKAKRFFLSTLVSAVGQLFLVRIRSDTLFLVKKVTFLLFILRVIKFVPGLL